MIDVFVSHRSVDKNIADEVCSHLKEIGISCWISYRSQDLPPGKEYPKRIKEAIDNSKIFVVLLSKNSILSEQVQQEIYLANERQRFGMCIFPVVIDPDISIEDINNFAGYVLAGKELAYWNNQDSKNELLDQISQCIRNTILDKTVKINSRIPDMTKVIGRKDELNLLIEKLDASKSGKICLYGVGGIGKTALLKKLCHSEYISNYNTVVYMSVEKCIYLTIANDDILCMEDENLKSNKKQMSSYAYAYHKLALLENSVDEHTLIILDNMDQENDPLLDRICNLKCDLIISTRKKYSAFAGFETIPLSEIKSKEVIIELFEYYYGEKLKEEEHDYLYSLLKDAVFHTLTIVLFAKQMKYLGKRPRDYKNVKQFSVERSGNLIQYLSKSEDDIELANTYSRLSKIFDAKLLSNDEKKVMKTMCILPSAGCSRSVYFDLIDRNLIQTILKLEKIGWIESDTENKLIILHPVIRDIVMCEIDIYYEDPDISLFVSNFVKKILNCWDAEYEENVKYREIALALYFQFPNPVLARFKDYLVLSKLLWVLDLVDISVEIQNKVKMLFVDEKGNRLNSSEEAEAFLQIGYTDYSKGDYEGAAEDFFRSVQIYSNRLAAALSHLAQTYMMMEDKSFEEIEKLHRSSLSLREQYWSGTKSEAAACHLYAKTLSNYNQKLDFALKLEKRAHQIFSNLEPDGVNVSSTAYILGWLYVQTAEDENDIQYGIDKLLEAKRIRIKRRGNPLHSWMEDIYLKLGQSYEKLKDYENAKENYELVLQIRKIKYAVNPSHKQLLRIYELLQNVYVELDDKPNAAECRRYIRYNS